MILILSIIFFVLYLILIGTVIGVGFYRQLTKERSYFSEGQKIDVADLIVLIPYRNEAHRIQPLLRAIGRLKTLPQEFIFIDDHSDDGTDEVIRKELEIENYRILSSPVNNAGKKRALRFGTANSESKYILTWDADVEVEPDYFEHISQLGEADMYVLPAVMLPEKFLEHFYEIDLVLVTAANAGLSGLKRPIMASGANLLYKRSTFHQVDDLESHIHAASGDDTYLLRDFRENEASVRLVSDRRCAITTETPRSFKEFIDQRLRWIGKTNDIKDHLSTTLALSQALLTVGFFAILTYLILTGDWLFLVTVFGLKVLIDMLLFQAYFSRLKRLGSWFLIPIYELLFPIYTLIIAVLLTFYKPKWKGRELWNKNEIQ